MRASPGRLGHLYLASRLHPDDVVLTVVGLPCLCLSAFMDATLGLFLHTGVRTGSDLSAPRPLSFGSGWGYARNESMSKADVCFAMLAGLEPAPCET